MFDGGSTSISPTTIDRLGIWTSEYQLQADRRIHLLPYNAGWQSEMPVELPIDENNRGCENGVESAGFPDGAVDGTFGKAESEGPSSIPISCEKISRDQKDVGDLQGLWREMCVNGMVDFLR